MNGISTHAEQFPFMAMVAIAGRAQAKVNLQCGATIIGPRRALTAAHCVDGLDQHPERIEVVVGRTKITSNSGRRIKVQAVSIVPAWNPGTFDGDVAVLKLASVAGVEPIALASAEELAAASNGIILGWGSVQSEYLRYPDALHAAEVPLQSDGECKTYLGDAYHPETMLCAGRRASADGAKDGIDACYGDSGGPLLIKNAQGTYSQAGIVSWGLGCAGSRAYGVYTRLPTFVEWVRSDAPVAPFAKESVRINGVVRVGNTLRCNPGNWGGTGRISFGYEWYDSNGRIAGVESRRLKIRKEQMGRFIFCVVTGRSDAGTGIAASPATRPVGARQR